MAVDKNAGDRHSVAAGGRGGDERLRTSLWMSSGCSRGQLACGGGLGGAVHGRAHCGRPLAAAADLTAALWSSRGGSAAREGAGVLAVRGEWPERARGGGSGTRRLGARACKTCALGAPRARTLGVRRNAKSCQGTPIHKRLSREGL